MTPNHALRTAPCVTAPASCLRLSPTAQGPRQPRRSLSLGSLGVMRALPLLAALMVAGCSDAPIGNYPKTISDGLTSVPFAAEFAALFPQARHTISYFTGEYGPPTWNSETGIANRYVLTMQIPVTLDRTACRVTSYGTPHFSLNEITAVSLLPDGRRFMTSHGRNIEFGVSEWQSFRERRGDLSVFGITTPIVPIPNFEKINQ